MRRINQKDSQGNSLHELQKCIGKVIEKTKCSVMEWLIPKIPDYTKGNKLFRSYSVEILRDQLPSELS